MEIIEATSSDAKFIRDTIEDGFNEKHFYKKLNRTQIEKFINKQPDGGLFFIIKYNDKKAGFAYCGAIKIGVVYEINMLYIKKEFRNNGLATNFIKFYENRLLSFLPTAIVRARCDINHSQDAINIFKKLQYKTVSNEVTPKYNFIVLEHHL